MKYLVFLLLFFVSINATSQVMQTTGGAGGNKFRALKADSFLVVPSGADTANLANPKYGEGTTGAIFVKTTDSTLWFKVGGKWVQAGSGGTGGGGGTITNISFRPGSVVDTLYYTDSGGDVDWYWVVVKDGLISGGQVTYTGFARTYAISAALFRKNGQFYTTNDTTITIAALSNPDSSRSDVFIVNTSGQATTLTGVESANPLTPQIDPDTEVYLTHVTLSPSAPSAGIDTTVIYDENTEWVGGASGVTVNFAGTTTPYRGTKVTDVSAINSADIIGYGTGTAVNRTSYAGISLFLKLKATMPNNNNILVSFFNGNTQVSSEVALPITKTNTASYQGLSLGFDAFTFTNNLFDSVRFRYNGSGITGLYLDFIYLQNGMAPVVINPGTDFVQNIRRVGDNIEQQKNGVWTPVIDISDKKSGTVTSLSQGYGIINSTNPITTTGTQRIDTFAIATRNWRDKLADSLGAIIATKGSGTVTNFSAGDLSPLFTTSEATTTTTPALSFSLSNAGSYTVFGNQTNASAAPSFAKLNINTIDATGTPSASTYLRGDGSWQTVSGGASIDSVAIRRYGWTRAQNIRSWNAGGYSAAANGIASANTTTSNDSANYLIGYIAGNDLTTGYRNFFIGSQTGAKATTAYRNISIGSMGLAYNSGATAFTGYDNVVVGHNSAITMRGGHNNTIVGTNSGTGMTTAVRNIIIGNGSANTLSTSSDNVIVGWAALASNNNAYNVAVGTQALWQSTGSQNLGIGYYAGGGLTSGSLDAIGYFAGLSFTTGTNNFSYGNSSGQGSGSTITGSSNMFIGIQAGRVPSNTANINSNRNTAVGNFAFWHNAGNDNTIIGHAAGNGSVSPSTFITANNNIAIGSYSLLPSLSSSNQITFWVGGSTGYNALTRFTGGGWLINNTTSSVTSATASAALEINGTTGAVLFPRLTTTQRDALTATNGMVIYNSTTDKLQVYAAGAWTDLH